jgi:16S rRNA (guanine527-N7)-methyltransferase
VEKTGKELELTPNPLPKASLREKGSGKSPFMNIILKYFSDFTPKQLQQFESLNDLYKEWNEKINVISRKDIDGLYERHILHSLSIAAVFGFQPGSEIVDLGTGGGFPGIPLSIFFPDVKFHLVDSIAKKLKVVAGIAETVGLSNVTTQHSRIEDIKNRKFDFVVSRAVAPLKDLWRWSRPLLRTKKTEAGALKRDSNVVIEETNHSTTRHSSLTTAPGLICLKGGDLAREIQESNTRPRLVEIKDIFDEEYFKDKHILFIAR